MYIYIRELICMRMCTRRTHSRIRRCVCTRTRMYDHYHRYYYYYHYYGTTTTTNNNNNNTNNNTNNNNNTWAHAHTRIKLASHAVTCGAARRVAWLAIYIYIYIYIYTWLGCSERPQMKGCALRGTPY